MLELIATVLIKAFGAWLTQKEADKEMWELFYKFTAKFQKNYLNSSKLTNIIRAQNKWLDSQPFVETQ